MASSRWIAATVLVLAAAISSGSPHAQSAASDPWFRQSASPKDFEAPRVSWDSFSIQLPKDWQLTPGFTGFLLNAVEKTKKGTTGAAIVIEQMALAEPLTQNDVDSGLAELEAVQAKGREPASSDYRQQAKDVGGRRFVFLQYTRPGLTGPDQVTVYAMPAGRIMYRVICIAPASRASAYQSTFAHVAWTFKPKAAS